MEFRFNINNILPKRINKITHTLLPENFRGDRREFNECQRLLTRILDEIGEASAKAQGLNKTITSATKLRDTDHIIYLMIDNNGSKGLGSVVGLLKTGSKSLFMADENGCDFQLKPRCILDFYIHESRQRMGLGKELYEYMMMEENVKPIKLAIDRPSEKFLSFLSKYYGLETIIPQNNKFVVFQGFFDDELPESKGCNKFTLDANFSNKSNSAGENQFNKKVHSSQYNSVEKSPSANTFGRYAASRPPCSMASIIHNLDTNEKYSRSKSSGSAGTMEKEDFVDSADYVDELEGSSNEEVQPDGDSLLQRASEVIDHPYNDVSPRNDRSNDSYDRNQIYGRVENADDKSEFTSDSIERNLENQDVVESESLPGLEKGHLDLKFYHSPLW